ncbi:MAG TPA: c-type cytochrome [Rhizomicrobium sp.]|jgi:quinoprotein glucose dehydrogenase|nr:c-type cytochrome [Rhizomicrobium sp.]
MKTHLLIVLAGAALFGASGIVLAQSSTKSIWDGAYTTAQAARGKTAYANNCSRCHGSSLEGNDEIPALTGAHLMVDFDGQTAGDLVHRIQSTMPMDNPGTLNMATVTDIATFILQSNGLPAGNTELPADPSAQTLVRFEAVKPGSK